MVLFRWPVSGHHYFGVSRLQSITWPCSPRQRRLAVPSSP